MKTLMGAAIGTAFLTVASVMPTAEARVLTGGSAESSRQVLPVQARGEPAISELRGGRLEARFRNGCRVLFNESGQPLGARYCERGQAGRAADVVAAHLRREGRRLSPHGANPRVYRLDNGNLQVVYRGGCRVVFNRQGRAFNASRCPRGLEQEAHQVAARYLRRDRGRRAPTVRELRGGRLQVEFRSGCRMTFNRRGRQLDANRCTRGQESRGRDAVAVYLRRHSRRGPEIREIGRGRLQVDFRGKCRMTFNRRGRQLESNRCTRGQESRGRDAVAAYLRQHGRSGGPRRGPRARRAHIVEHHNGRLEVVYREGCRVHFNRRGRVRDTSRCSPDQERRARRMVSDYMAARRR